MAFRTVTEKYFKKLEKFHQESRRVNEMTGELSYRPSLNEYFNDVEREFGEHIANVYEPKQQARAGRPDWRFYDKRSLGIYGYVEAKAFSEEKHIRVEDYTEQVEKYLSLGYRVILTDGVEFVFFDPSDKSHITYTLIDKNTDGALQDRISSDLTLIETEFGNFFGNLSARRISEQQLVAECAIRARYLSDEVESLADLRRESGLNELENEAIEILSQLREVVQKHHDPLLRDKKVFSAFVSQVLIFGLIYAHRVLGVENMNPIDRYTKLKEFWLEDSNARFTQDLKPFRALTKLLREEISSVGALGVWYEDCCLMLSHVELREDQISTPDYHGLFERFLAAFDPKTRFDYGAFYTPKELAAYTVALVEEINGKEFNGSIYDKGNRLIDPCCGTGSFLERLLMASVRSGGNATIIGFEILPAPYALAHYRIAKVSPDYPDMNIVLTNTLSDVLEGGSTGDYQKNLFEDEQQAARDLAKPPLTLVIGNPPSSDSFSHSNGSSFSIIQNLLEDFRPPTSSRSTRQNTQKQLQNEFVKFLRWTGNKAVKTGNSIVALVLPASFAESPSYKYARKWFTQNFDKFWIIDIDKDGRTGVRSSSIFHTLQGRLLFVALREQSRSEKMSVPYNFISISDFNLDEKNAFFEMEADAGESMLQKFETFETDLNDPIFRPRKDFDRERYSSFWSLFKNDSTTDDRYIFERHCSGLKLAPSSLFVHTDEPILFRRSDDIANDSINTNDILSRWYKGQDRPPAAAKFSPTVRSAFKEKLSGETESSTLYSYRPMLNLPALISEEILSVLARAPGGGTRYRPEILSAYTDKRTFGIAIAPSPKDLGEELHRFASFCWYLPDNDLSKRGNAHVFCNYFPEYKQGRRAWDDTPQVNINRDLLLAVGEQSPDKILFYVYGILCSNAYLDAFEPVLFTPSGSESPRIPVSPTTDLFNAVAALGEELALLEKHIPDDEMFIEGSYSQHLDRFDGDFKMTDFRISVESESIVLKDGNKEFEIKPIPTEILGFRVGGYQVLQQWLKMHSHAYTRTDFTKNHLRRLLFLLQSLEKQVDIVNRLDEKVKVLISG
ncbi:MAG: type ISP restriction/modification enzyme [Patescibacteria group bacterium UBA2163]